VAVSGVSLHSGYQAPLHGMNAACGRMAQASESIASGQGDIAAASVEIAGAKIQFQLSAMVLKLFNDMNESMIDVLA
jgi:hypothetical protein